MCARSDLHVLIVVVLWCSGCKALSTQRLGMRAAGCVSTSLLPPSSAMLQLPHPTCPQVPTNLSHSLSDMYELQEGALQPVINLLSSSCPESQREAALLLGQFATQTPNDDGPGRLQPWGVSCSWHACRQRYCAVFSSLVRMPALGKRCTFTTCLNSSAWCDHSFATFGYLLTDISCFFVSCCCLHTQTTSPASCSAGVCLPSSACCRLLTWP
jgi:hypothetical protein